MKEWTNKHPAITMWIILSIFGSIILVYEARDVGLELSQWFWMIVLTSATFGLCAWIVMWGDDDEDAEAEL